MCYYNSLKIPAKKNIKLKGKEKELPTVDIKVQSGFSYASWPIIIENNTGEWQPELAHWEFIPWFIQHLGELEESRKKYTTLNATAEKLFESKLYQAAAKSRRCLVLSTGFYEWRHHQGSADKKPVAYPYFIGSASKDEPLFYMAGIWQPWTDKLSGEMIHSFAIVTTQANGLMQKIHNTKKRMPTILPTELAEEWISPLKENRIKELANYQIKEDALTAHSIAKDFNRGMENPEALVEYDSLPPL
jgi:putative SOS response-associated peptidase YedK